MPNGIEAIIGTAQWIFGVDVHANQNNPMGNKVAPTEQPTSLASGGTGLPCASARCAARL